MDNVGQEIIVFESVVDVHFLVVDSQRSRFDAAFLSKVDKKVFFKNRIIEISEHKSPW